MIEGSFYANARGGAGIKVVHNKIVYVDIVAKIIYALVVVGIIVLWICLHQSESFDQVRPMESDE